MSPIDTSGLGLPKPEPRKRQKARKDRIERQVATKVRADVDARDGYCRWYWFDETTRRTIESLIGPCGGPSEWAHLISRAETRGMAPEIRHSTENSCKMCRDHHQSDKHGYDRHRFDVEAVTDRGADGPLRIVLPDGRGWEEPAR
jgi:hypothetical protein